jgi:hypothetical protein
VKIVKILLVADHVHEGRGQFNVSEWTCGPKEKADLAEASREQIERGDMPLGSYLPLHPEAVLSDAEKAALIAGLEKSLK